MKKNIFVGALFLFLWGGIVNGAHAAVLINEIAWMGTGVSANAEWIEIANTGSDTVDLSGWTLVALDGAPSITLSGTISPNGYFLIERTSDDTVPSITADQIYAGALSNSGETLMLKNSAGDTVDTVVGGENWANVGGDNSTKDTAQRTVNSWITGTPTPRGENIAAAGEVLGASTVTIGTTTSSGGTTSSGAASGGGTVKSPYPRDHIVVGAGEDKRAFAGFPVIFSGSSLGLYDEPLTRATYRWNFGDGAVSDVQAPTHVYEFPGEYVVTLEVFWGGHRSTDRLAVTVSDPDVVISKVVSGERGYIELTDRTDREIDLSGWSIAGDTGASFVFPPNSVVLSKKTFLLSHRVSGIDPALTRLTLRYPDGSEAATWGNKPTVAPKSTYHPLVVSPARVSPVPATEVLGVSYAPKEETLPQVVGTTSAAAAVLWQGGSPSAGGPLAGERMKWVFVFLATVLAVVAAVIIAKSNIDEPTIADEYAIIEDIIEGKEGT